MTNPATKPEGLLVPSPAQAVLGLRAMKMIARDVSPTAPAGRLLEAAKKLILHVDADLFALTPIQADELVAGFKDDPALATQLVQAMVVVSLAAGLPTVEQSEQVQRFASALQVDEPAVKTTRLFAERSMLLARLDFFRRSNIRDMIAREAHEGVVHLVKSLLGLRGFLEDSELAAKYRALEGYPKNTLGFALYHHYRTNGFALPGEKYGFPEAGVYHDLTHVLSGYGTDPRGEIQVGAFTSGYRKKNAFYTTLLGLLLFNADVNVTPIPHEHTYALLGEAGMAEKFLRAIQRGFGVKVDLSDDWDFWPLLHRTVDDARAELGISAIGA